jgi:hypothetical protein
MRSAPERRRTHLGQLLTKQREQAKAIQGFREALAELPELLKPPTQADGNSDRPLIFIIDELDRCQPTFALEILERMKHFFAVPKVHFVLGANLDQLRNSISVAYAIDAQVYLQKFIQLTMFLVDQGQYHHERVTTKFLNHLMRVLEFKQEHIELVQEAAAVFRHAAEHRNLSLRAIEQMMSALALALAYKPQNALCPGCILGGLFAKAKAGTLISKR